MAADQATDRFDDTVLEAFRPQTRRYDVAIDDELVLSVLPNGVKTWTWVYDNPEDPHRKTLGIYPDMTLEDARKSLATERAAYRRASEEISPAFVIRDGRIEPAEQKSSQTPIIAGVAAAVVVAVLAALLLLGGNDDSGSAAPAGDEALVKPATESTPPIQLPGINRDDGTSVADDTAISTAAADRSPTIGRLDATLRSVRDELPAASSTAAPATLPEPVSLSTPEIAPAPSPAPVTEPVVVASMRTEPVEDDPADIDGPATEAGMPAAPSTDDNPATVAEMPTTLTNDATDIDRPATAVGMRVDTSRDVLLDARIARGNLTSAVVQREPVDDLGTYIIGNGADLQTYYFFTELRELAGQRVRHRWIQGDRIVAEIPFDVGDAWRWRVYSSKTFIPSMAGSWQIQVLLEDDTVIYNLPFDFTP